MVLLIGLLSSSLAPAAWGAGSDQGPASAEVITPGSWFSPAPWLGRLWTDWLRMDWLVELIEPRGESTPTTGASNIGVPAAGVPTTGAPAAETTTIATPTVDKQTGWVEPGG